MMETKDNILSNCSKKNENNQLVSFNGQSKTIRLSFRENFFLYMPKTIIKSRLQSIK